MAGLGLFKVKEKKAIQAEIDSLNKKLEEETKAKDAASKRRKRSVRITGPFLERVDTRRKGAPRAARRKEGAEA